MEKKYFVLKTHGNRPSFPQDMNNEERAVMQEHVTYWTGLADKGTALLFGPVIEPEGTYGLGIIAIENEIEINSLFENDPAIKAGILSTKAFQMNAVLSKFWKIEKE